MNSAATAAKELRCREPSPEEAQKWEAAIAAVVEAEEALERAAAKARADKTGAAVDDDLPRRRLQPALGYQASAAP
jgi:hypothetical protein